MGMSQSIACPNGVPSWPAVRDRLAASGYPAQMRMIDANSRSPTRSRRPTGAETSRRHPGRHGDGARPKEPASRS